jgi:hypothetical protein
VLFDDSALRILAMAGLSRLEQVETLVIIAGRGPIDDEQLARELSVPRNVAVDNATSLVDLGFVIGPEPWRLAPNRTDMTESLLEIERTLQRDRGAVVNSFYALRLQSLRAFSDAFRLRKDK